MIEEVKIERLAQIKDGSLSERALLKELGFTGRQQLADFLSSMPEKEADKWLAKLNIGDRFVVNSWVVPAREEKAKAALADGNNHSGEMAIGAVLAGGALTAEAGARLAELIDGTEQTYNANLTLTDLREAFEAALQNSAIKVEMERSGSDEGEFVLFDDDDQELLRVQVRNSQEKTSFDEVAYDATDDRLLGRAYVRITKSDMENLAGQSLDAVADVTREVSRLGKSAGLTEIIGVAMQGFSRGKEVFDIANLPRLLANEIEKLAQAAEELQQRETRDIKERNQARLEEVKGGLVCVYCGNNRSEKEEETDEETVSCASCGGQLKKRTESVAVLEEDKERLARVGLTF